LLIFFLPVKAFCQDIAGVWTGSLYNDTTRQFIRYELAISEYNGKLNGYSHTIFDIDSVENTGVKSVKIKKSGEKFLVEDEKLIYNNYPEPPAKGVKTFSELDFSENDSAIILSGTWKTNQTKIFKKLTGKVFLQKRKVPGQTLIIPKLDSLGLVSSLSFYDPIINSQGRHGINQRVTNTLTTNENNSNRSQDLYNVSKDQIKSRSKESNNDIEISEKMSPEVSKGNDA
jgi:hypothetical protein